MLKDILEGLQGALEDLHQHVGDLAALESADVEQAGNHQGRPEPKNGSLASAFSGLGRMWRRKKKGLERTDDTLHSTMSEPPHFNIPHSLL
jgi:hypothetical protein